MRKVEEVRNLITEEHKYQYHNGSFGEILCYHIHGLGISFKQLAKHFDITLNELAEVIADHIRKL